MNQVQFGYVARLLVGSTLVLAMPGATGISARDGIENLIASQASTAVCGTLNSDTTWLLASSPYVVCAAGVIVMPAAVLTVQPGVTVQFQNASGNRLVVNGALHAIGTVTQPITFTGALAAPGSWGGVFVGNTAIAPARAELSRVVLEYGGLNATSGGQLVVDLAVVTVTHSLLRNGDGVGVLASQNRPQLVVQDTAFMGHTRSAVQLDQPRSDMLMHGLSASGNGNDAILISGTTQMYGRRRWVAAGIPYLLNAPVTVVAGESLQLEPGVELQFLSSARLGVLGELKAVGLPTAPITLTGKIKTPGAWPGIDISAPAIDQASVQLEFVTVEYGGSLSEGANIVVGFGGQLVARDSQLRFSAKDGLRNNNASSSIALQNSRIYSNSLYGVRNPPLASAILASNNWWGHPDGPRADTVACSTGLGDKVTDGVIFRPVLTDALSTRPFPLTEAPILTMTPRRWFAPANNLTRVYFDLQLRDANGAPMSGRRINLASSLGTVTDGGITDTTGKTLGYVVSSIAGEANVKASLNAPAACEPVMSPKSKVTFEPTLNITELFPDSPASYFSDDISVTPLPVLMGVTTTIHAKLSNPLSVPITVDVSFAFADANIGLAFGPINELVGLVIPAGGSLSLASAFVPPVSGHYCVEVAYNITAVGAQQLERGHDSGSGRRRLNLNTYGGSMGRPNDKDILNKADKSFSTVSKLTPKPLKVQKAIVNGWWGWAKDTASKIAIALGGDPPRQDYTTATVAVWHRWPDAQPGLSVSAARASAMNATSAALADGLAYGRAAAIALDRFGGASEAGNLEWAAQQANARLYYEEKLGNAMLAYADALEAFVLVLTNESETDTLLTAADALEYQQRISTTGFTAQEVADAHVVGLSDAEIETFRLAVIAADPNAGAVNLLTIYSEEAATSRALGRALLTSDSFEPGLSVSGSPGLNRANAMSNTLAQVGGVVETVKLGNPLTSTALIDVRVRRIGLPPDWIVSVSPAQISLAAGAQTTITVTVSPGTVIPQNSIARMAVEGYAGNQLLGGVVFDVLVPKYVAFAPYHAFLPLATR